MKSWALLLSLLCFSLPCHASDEQVKKDFILLCEISKFAGSLAKNPEFNDPAMRAVIVGRVEEAVMQSEEVKKVLLTLAAANPKDKVALTRKAAAEAGLTKWTCPTLKNLF